jgi:hypothetical protein
MRVWSIAVCCIVPHAAYASDLSINAGVLDVVSPEPAHVGVYPYVGLSVVLPHDRVTVIPTVAIEWSPDLGTWGFSGAMVVDVPVARRIGLDVITSFVHDQIGDAWSEAAFYAGLGGGVSLFRDKWTLSPSVSVLRGLNVDAWTLAVALNTSYSF